MKYSQIAGAVIVVGLMLSGLLNWTWYPDLQQYFTGFYTHTNAYGRPGRVFIALGVVIIILFLVPRTWAKRGNVFLCALTLAYAIKTFIVFSACYRGICPVRQPGIWIMLTCAVFVMIAALLPDVKLKKPPAA